MQYFEDIVNEAPDSIGATLGTTATQVAKLLGATLKKIDKKAIKKDFALLKKLNVLQTAFNSIQDNF